MLPTLSEDGVRAGASADDVLDVEVVVGVGRLKPGAAVVQIQMKGVGGGELTVDAIEDVKLVAFVVEDDELGRIEEAPGVEAVDLDEVAPVLAAVAEIDRAGGRAEGAVGGGDAAGWLGDSLAGAGCDLDDEAGLAAKLGRRGAGDDFERLDRVGRKLVGEDLALLVGDGLAVDGERVGRVVAEAVEEAVGVGRRRRARNQRHQRLSEDDWLSSGSLLNSSTVDIGMKG